MLLGIFKSIFTKIVEFIMGFFAFIPCSIYFLYTSCASFLDLLHMLIRKLAGLDVYYVNGKKQSGDIVVSFIRGILGLDGDVAAYSTLRTVFWSMVVFGVIMVFLTTIIMLIKSHYNYDAKKSQPMEILTIGLKSLFTLAVVPIVTVFGLYMSQLVLQTLDKLTNSGSSTNIEALYGDKVSLLHYETMADGTKAYASYDVFMFGNPTNSVTFSGMLFKLAANECNRLRTGSYFARSDSENEWLSWENCDGLFSDPNKDEEKVAMKIDEAFACRLRLKSPVACQLAGEAATLASAYLSQPHYNLHLFGVQFFSKYLTGLVFYYYDLWSFNYFIAFAGIAALLTLMINIVFGLIQRMLMCIALFLIYGPLVGIIPLDGGNAYKNWKKEFLSNILMAYGAIVGTNIFFIILPFVNSISFFGGWGFLDGIMNMLIVISGLSVIKKFIKLVSGFIGAADANETGKALADDVKSTGMKAAKMTMMAAGAGLAVGMHGMKLNNKIFDKALAKTKDPKAKGISKFLAGAAVGLSAPGKFVSMGLGGFNKKHQKNVRKALGLKDDEAVTPEHEKKYGQMQQLLKTGNVDADKVKHAFGKDGNQEEIDNVIKENNQVANDNLVAQGKKPVEAEDGQVITQGSEAEKNPTAWQAVGKGFLDIGGASLKLAGDMTGLSKFVKDLGEAGVIDEAKPIIAKFGQEIGAFKGGVPESLKTKKEKEKEEKAASKEMKTAQDRIADNTQATLDAIRKLTTELQKKSK